MGACKFGFRIFSQVLLKIQYRYHSKMAKEQTLYKQIYNKILVLSEQYFIMLGDIFKKGSQFQYMQNSFVLPEQVSRNHLQYYTSNYLQEYIESRKHPEIYLNLET